MTHHGACLRVELEATGVSADDAACIEASALGGPPCALLSAADTVIIAFARKLTRAPATMNEADVIALRDAGFTDRAIYDVTAIAGFFGFVNRVVSGLGVPLEDNWRDLLGR